MAPQRIEHDGGQRHEYDVAHFRGCVREHARKHDDDRHGPRVRLEHHAANQRGQQPRTFGDADAEQRDEHGAERHEAREVGHEVEDDAPKAIGVHQADDFDQAIGGAARSALGARIGDRNLEPAEQAAQQDDGDRKQREQRDRMGQGVAQRLDDAQELRHARGLGWRHFVSVGIRHWDCPVRRSRRVRSPSAAGRSRAPSWRSAAIAQTG